MNFVIFKLIVSSLFALGVYSNGDLENMALENLEDGDVRYVYVVENQERNRNANPEKDLVAVNYRHYNGSGLSTGTYGTHQRNLTFPIAKTTLDLSGDRVNVQNGSVIVTKDDRVLLVENVYPDGRIAGYEVKSSTERGQGTTFVPKAKSNVVIVDSSEVRASRVDCFLGICESEWYVKSPRDVSLKGEQVSYIALACDMRIVENYLKRWKFSSTQKRPSCRVGNKLIVHGVFNDGTVLSGPLVFNPFPTNTDRYFTPEEIQSQSSRASL